MARFRTDSEAIAATLADLAIVVVTWRNAAELPALLVSLASTLAAGAELVVVDNASSDATVAEVRRHAPSARVVANSANRGFAAAANQGFAASARPFVLFLNPDAVVEPGAVAQALACLDRQPSVAVVGCRTLNADGTPQPTVDRFHSVRALAVEALGERRRGPRGAAPPASGLVDWVYGSFLLARREALAPIGGFDEAYEMYGEDLDLCHRLAAAGWRIAYCAEATIVHHGNRSGATRYGADRDRAVLRGTLRFFRRRRGRAAALAFRAAAGGAFVLRAMGAAWAARRGDPEAALRARRYLGMAGLCLSGDPAGRRADRARLRVPQAPGIEGA
ncbi:MAG: glycosyltransferase family 2 protein [Deltaproteobacteria bacterium]|nr:glycosyltransferase family 2 protein [Deltaproteobacteria bacterium]